jgi:membrane fusion protein, multidrug efflux system
MSTDTSGSPRRWARPAILLATVAAVAAGLTASKSADLRASAAAAAAQPEPTELVAEAVAVRREHRRVTTAVGTVLALRSITLRNELAGTVRHVALVPGQIVDSGTVLVALDVAIEEAELHAQEAQAELARTGLARSERLGRTQATSQEELDRARAEYAIALAQVERTRAVIGRKTIRAPFRARVGIADVHPGQYLNDGTQLTTLQGVGDGAHVDFAVAQDVAAGLRPGDKVNVIASDERILHARIAAVDARIDPATRNATVRARLVGSNIPAPGSSVRVQVPVGPAGMAVAVPVIALRKGPGGDHVFILQTDSAGETRAHARQVQSGPVLGEEVVILGGLRPGERVAASGSFKLREAVRVQVAPTPVALNDRP